MGRGASLKKTFIFSFIMIVVSMVGIIGFIVFSSWKSSVSDLIVRMEDEATKKIIDNVESFINFPLAINAGNYTIIKQDIVDIYDPRQREPYFASVLRSTPDEVYSFSYGTEQGEYYGARRNAANEIEIMRSDATTNGNSYYFSVTDDLSSGKFIEDFGDFDPRTRDWYIIAKEKKKATFSPIYKHFVMNDLAITASHPIYTKEGTLKGVLGIHLTLSKINNYLHEIAAEKNATAYIVDKTSGQVVANSLNRPNFRTLSGIDITGIEIEDIGNPYILEAYQQYMTEKKNHLITKTEDDRLHIKLTEYNKEGLDWLIITTIPESVFTGPITTTIRNAALLAFILLIIGIMLWVHRVGQVLKPIYLLKQVTEKFSTGDLSHRAIISSNDEIGDLSGAFNQMAEKLQTLVFNLNERFLKSFNMNPNIMILVSLQDNTYIDVNEAFLKASGLVRRQIIGQSTDSFNLWLNQEDRAKAVKLLFSQTSLSNYELQYRAYGGIRTGLLSSEKIAIEGKPCVLYVITDITAKKQLDTELARFDSLNLIGEMAASIGHEVRNPMTTVRGYLQLFDRNPKFASHSVQIELMIEEIDRANAIITEFLSLSKNKNSELKLSNLNDVIHVLFPLLQADALHSGHTVLVAPSSLPDILLDTKEIRQLILNLVRNAMEAMDSTGAVTIKTYCTRDEIILEVIDTGRGIAPEILSKLGTPFLTTKESGTGLGLAVCYRIAQRHGAKIEVASSSAGTTFSVRFKAPPIQEP